MRNGNPNGPSTGKGVEEKGEDGDIEKRTLGVRRPVNEECQEAKPIADSAQRETPSRSVTEIRPSQKSV